MEKNGSILDIFANAATAAESAKVKLENSKHGLSYSTSLSHMTECFRKAIASKDYNLILDLEEAAQNFDKVYANDEKEVEKIEALFKVQSDIKDRWDKYKDADYVKSQYVDLIRGKQPHELTPKQRQDTGMQKLINSKNRYFSQYACGTSNDAEQNYFLIRKTGMLALGVAHQKDIDKVLVPEKALEQDRGR